MLVKAKTAVRVSMMGNAYCDSIPRYCGRRISSSRPALAAQQCSLSKEKQNHPLKALENNQHKQKLSPEASEFKATELAGT